MRVRWVFLASVLMAFFMGTTAGLLLGVGRSARETHAVGAVDGDVVAVTGHIINGTGDVLYVVDKPSKHLLVYGYYQDGSLRLFHSRKIECDLRPLEFSLMNRQHPPVKSICDQTKPVVEPPPKKQAPRAR